MARQLAESARQRRQVIESMALSTAMQHSLAQMQKSLDETAGYRRLFAHQTALLSDVALAQKLQVLAKQTLALTAADPVTQISPTVAAQLAAVFAQQRQRGVDTLAVYNALQAQPKLSASLTASLSSLALANAPEHRDRTVAVLERVVREEITRPREETATVEGVDTTLGALLAGIWAGLVEQLQALSPEVRATLLALIVQALLQVGDMMRDRQQAVEGDRANAAALQATERVEAAVRAQTEAMSRQQRFIATRAKPLRVNPDGSAKRVGTISIGATVEVRFRVDRWLFVTVIDGDAAGSEGWVFLRDLQPISP